LGLLKFWIKFLVFTNILYAGKVPKLSW
jgi:hypothetical protein